MPNPEIKLPKRRPATPAQIRANRANAQKSTGPRTIAGKAVCSQNALRHGFTGSFRMMGIEDENEYKELVAQLHADFKPANVLEAMILERMAQHHWVVQRAIRLQTGCLEEALFIVENFNSLQRYHTSHERAFSRALADHLKLRIQRLKEEKSAPTPPPPDQTPEVLTATAEASAAKAECSSFRTPTVREEANFEETLPPSNTPNPTWEPREIVVVDDR